MNVVLYGDLGTMFEGTGAGNGKTDLSMLQMSVSVVAGAGRDSNPATFRS